MCVMAEITVGQITAEGIFCAKCMYISNKVYALSVPITTGNKSELAPIVCDTCGVKL